MALPKGSDFVNIVFHSEDVETSGQRILRFSMCKVFNEITDWTYMFLMYKRKTTFPRCGGLADGTPYI
jgi:hypothetical protein